jgi:hypothetical protein
MEDIYTDGSASGGDNSNYPEQTDDFTQYIRDELARVNRPEGGTGAAAERPQGTVAAVGGQLLGLFTQITNAAYEDQQQILAEARKHLEDGTEPDLLRSLELGMRTMGNLGAVGPMGTMTGTVGARNLAAVDTGVAATNMYRQAPRAIHELIEQMSAAGRKDTDIISVVNQRIAESTNTINNLPGTNFNNVFGGVSRGADGRWRLELSDKSGALSQHVLDRTFAEIPSNSVRSFLGLRGAASLPSERSVGMLGDMFHHPMLYEMYPQLENIPVKITRGAKSGIFEWVNGGPSIRISAPDAQEARRVLLHEIQHGIQHLERFSSGGLSHYFRPDDMSAESIANWRQYSAIAALSRNDVPAARTLMNTLPASAKNQVDNVIVNTARETFHGNIDTDLYPQFRGTTVEDVAKYLDDISIDDNALIGFATRVDRELYRRIRGEVEARNVEGRAHMSGEELRDIPPRRTEDRARALQWENSASTLAPQESTRYNPRVLTIAEADRSNTIISRRIASAAARIADPVTREGRLVTQANELRNISQQITNMVEQQGINRTRATQHFTELTRARESLVERFRAAGLDESQIPDIPDFRAHVDEYWARPGVAFREAISRGFLPPNNPVTRENALGVLNELGLKVKEVRNAGGSTYITFEHPMGETLPGIASPRIRIPSPSHMHRATIAESEQGMMFDTTWEHRAHRYGHVPINDRTRRIEMHAFDQEGNSMSDIDNLRRELTRRFRPDLPEHPSAPPMGPDPNQMELPFDQPMRLGPGALRENDPDVPGPSFERNENAGPLTPEEMAEAEADEADGAAREARGDFSGKYTDEVIEEFRAVMENARQTAMEKRTPESLNAWIDAIDDWNRAVRDASGAESRSLNNSPLYRDWSDWLGGPMNREERQRRRGQ